MNDQDRLDWLTQMFDNFRITTQDGITAWGSMHTGYAIDTSGLTGAIGATGGVLPPPPPPILTGACCIGTDCSIETESDCINMGGTYAGDETTCDDVDCTRGACCDADGHCAI